MASPSIADMFTSTGLDTELHLDTSRYMMIPVMLMNLSYLETTTFMTPPQKQETRAKINPT